MYADTNMHTVFVCVVCVCFLFNRKLNENKNVFKSNGCVHVTNNFKAIKDSIVCTKPNSKSYHNKCIKWMFLFVCVFSTQNVKLGLLIGYLFFIRRLDFECLLLFDQRFGFDLNLCVGSRKFLGHFWFLGRNFVWVFLYRSFIKVRDNGVEKWEKRFINR